jgi:hypothetical protein
MSREIRLFEIVRSPTLAAASSGTAFDPDFESEPQAAAISTRTARSTQAKTRNNAGAV